ncbi:MAG: hypothetical protein A2W99_15410 [Bacteroidetes bacterium GWF2_33_16]|nr:MAG: hypothetical protein A2X00_09620 [Bacteroidetes bacterium GWE2_32_14]OFY07708.1 MAG: hypothetical protein A2W99_15410 [Bacteroidetes bacterium GWF2_33_16]
MKFIFRIVGILLFAFMIFNCSDNRCNEEVDVLLKAEIIVNDPILTNAGFLETLSIYSPAWTDSVHYSSANFMLELSPFADTTVFVFTSQAWKDTVKIFYERDLVYLSQECGFVTYYKIDSTRYTSTIDSLVWVNKKLTTLTDGHVKIYF